MGIPMGRFGGAYRCRSDLLQFEGLGTSPDPRGGPAVWIRALVSIQPDGAWNAGPRPEMGAGEGDWASVPASQGPCFAAGLTGDWGWGGRRVLTPHLCFHRATSRPLDDAHHELNSVLEIRPGIAPGVPVLQTGAFACSPADRFRAGCRHLRGAGTGGRNRTLIRGFGDRVGATPPRCVLAPHRRFELRTIALTARLPCPRGP